MNPFQMAYELAAWHLDQQPDTQLRVLSTWLDPLGSISEDALSDEDESLSSLGILYLAREVSDELYTDALLHLYQYGEDSAAACIIQRLNTLGIAADHHELYLGSGIPLYSMAHPLDEPEAIAQSPFLPLLEAFGLRAENEYDCSNVSYRAAAILGNDLINHPDSCYQQLGWAVQYAFGVSGNSLIDCDDELLCQMTPLAWTRDDFEYAIAMIAEAETIGKDALLGLHFYLDQPPVQQALAGHSHTLYRFLEKRNLDDHNPPSFSWPAADGQ